MPAKSIRELAVTTIISRLKLITTKGDAYSQTVVTVDRDKWDLAWNPSLPAVNVLEGDEEKSIEASDIYSCTLPVVIEYIANEIANPQPAKNAMLADLTKALGDRFTVTDSASMTTDVDIIQTANTQSPDSEDGIVWVQMAIELRYNHALTDETKQI